MKRFWFRFIRWLQGRDYCETCTGVYGVRGNENIVGGIVMCDYCTVKKMMEDKHENRF